MAKPNEILPIGGLNVDAENRNMAPMDYRRAICFRNGTPYLNKGGAGTNLKGNLEITSYACPYSGGTYPTGKNKEIGYFEDTINNTILYFVWNKNKKHQILRYYPQKTDANNPYGVVEQVMCYDFGWKQNERITSVSLVEGTSGDLVYWIDSTGLRKININRANICTKQKTWMVTLPNGTDNIAFGFQIVIKNILTGASITSIQVNVPPNLNREAILSYIAAQINAELNTYITATTCDCHMDITEVVENKYNVIFTEPLFYVIPNNWYGVNLIDRYFDRSKWMPLQAPQPEYKQDPQSLTNNVKDRVFQFRLAYDYDDFEKSAYGVISQLAINNLQCDGTSNPLYNYIYVDFNDPNLIDATVLVLFRQVTFCVLEQNTGVWKQVITLKSCDFLYYNGTTVVAKYDFYNNIISTAIDDTSLAKQNDGVPLDALAEVEFDNRLTTGGVTLGHNPPDCAQLQLETQIGETASQKLYEVIVKVRVLTYGLSDAEVGPPLGLDFYGRFPAFKKYPFWQDADPNINYAMQRGGIFHDTSRSTSNPTNNFAFFGGGGFGYGPGGDFGIRSGMEDAYDQRCPEAGFPLYTGNNLAITKQINIGLPTDGDGALDTSTQGLRDAIGAYLYQPSNNDLYHVAKFLLPAGKHVIRAASHWCSFGDKLGKGFAYDLTGTAYKSTSTNVWGVYSAGGGPYVPGSFQATKELLVDVTGDIADAGTFVIMDIAPPWDAGTNPDNIGSYCRWQPINGYLFDDSRNGIINDDMNSQNYSGVSVEKAVVAYGSDPSYVDVPPDPSLTQQTGWNETCITDHNGYFFGIGGLAQKFIPARVDLAYVIAYNWFYVSAYTTGPGPTFNFKMIDFSPKIFTGTITDYFNKTLTPLNFDGNHTINGGQPTLVVGCITTQSVAVRDRSSTFLTGRVIDQNGAALAGATATYEHGRVETTDTNGVYNILLWGDMLTPNLPFFSNATFNATSNEDRHVDDLIIAANPLCVVTYPNGQVINGINIIPIAVNPTNVAPPYSPTAHYPIADFIVNEIADGVVKTRKRGGKHLIGYRFADLQGRLCTVINTNEIYIPFETEDLGKFPDVVDSGGNPYPLGTYRGGIPKIQWQIPAAFKPPIWAATYQFMFSLDTFYAYWLQWVANSVTYLSKVASGSQPEVKTAYGNGDYVAVKISIANIVTYAQNNPKSNIGYTWTSGDRLRLLFDRDANLIHGLFDYEIVSFDTTDQSLVVNMPFNQPEIKSGFTIEIYRPKSVNTTETQIYYEMGEVYNCTNPNNANNDFTVRSGVFTSGDMFWHGTQIAVNDDLTNFSGTYALFGESQEISNFYPSTDTDQGRAGIVDENFKEVFYPSRLIVSDKFEPDTAVNGLSSYVATNTKDEGRQYGEVQRLLMVGKIMHAVMKNNNIANYVGVVTLRYSQSTAGVEAIADDYLGTKQPSLGNLGTDWPATIQQIDGYIYALYELRKTVWRFANDGNTEISRNEYLDQRNQYQTRMVTFFRELCENGIYDAVAIYDKRYREYILTAWRKATAYSVFQSKTSTTLVLTFNGNVPAVADDTATIYYTDSVTSGILPLETTISTVFYNGIQTLVGLVIPDTLHIDLTKSVKMEYKGEGTTVVWNETKNRWTYEYPVTPEGYATLGDNIFSFKDGKIWIHDVNPVRNNFYGVQYSTEVVPVFADEPTINKFWASLWMYQYQADNGCNWVSDSITNTNGQQSRLKAANWKRREQDWYISFKRDLTDTSVSNPITEGRVLRSSALEVSLTNDYTGELLVYGWKALWTGSERTSK